MRPRIRTLKPEVWEDEKVGSLPIPARLLFVGLITMADDEGRLRELPNAIRGHVFPYDGVSLRKLSAWLNAIVSTGSVIRYEVAGRTYLQFRQWERHQRVDRPSESVLPAPSVEDLSSNNNRMNHEGSQPRARGRARRSVPDPDPVVNEEDTPMGLLEYWRERCNHPSAKATRDRLAKVQARLNEGYSPDDIRKAIDGAARGAFVNDQGKRFDDIELICRNGSKLEDFMARAEVRGNPRQLPRTSQHAEHLRAELAKRFGNEEEVAA